MPVSKAIQPDQAKEKTRVKRETRRKSCSPKVGGGGGRIWYRALLECDWMLCCRGPFANLYLHKNSQRWKMPVSWEALAWVGEALGKRFHVLPHALSPLSPSPVWTLFLRKKRNSFSSNGQLVRWWVNERGEKREIERQSRRGGAGEERRQEEGSRWQWGDSDASFTAFVLKSLNGWTESSVGLISFRTRY